MDFNIDFKKEKHINTFKLATVNLGTSSYFLLTYLSRTHLKLKEEKMGLTQTN